jgi:hypothetical protein
MQLQEKRRNVNAIPDDKKNITGSAGDFATQQIFNRAIQGKAHPEQWMGIRAE